MDNKKNECESIKMFDVETGLEIEMIIADTAEYGGVKYMLVYESKSDNDEEAEAYIYKEINESGDEILYESVTDATELESAAALFQNPDYDYSLKF